MINKNQNEIDINQSIDIMAKDLAMQVERDYALGENRDISLFDSNFDENNSAKITEMQTLRIQLELQQEKISEEIGKTLKK